ncbi:MAG TPA: class I tRNA ligase family protein, partial [Candidatus Eisenbacteria bacterium]|nr:class I tRNA ligase family protein [Candidatus Eisenbacteria bacterium]
AKETVKPKKAMEAFLLLLSPFAPHLAEELWSRMGHAKSLAHEPWPAFDPSKTEDEFIEIPVMVNGKVKSKLRIPAALGEAEVERQAMADEKVLPFLKDKKILQKKYVPKKIFTIATS